MPLYRSARGGPSGGSEVGDETRQGSERSPAEGYSAVEKTRPVRGAALLARTWSAASGASPAAPHFLLHLTKGELR